MSAGLGCCQRDGLLNSGARMALSLARAQPEPDFEFAFASELRHDARELCAPDCHSRTRGYS